MRRLPLTVMLVVWGGLVMGVGGPAAGPRPSPPGAPGAPAPVAPPAQPPRGGIPDRPVWHVWNGGPPEFVMPRYPIPAYDDRFFVVYPLKWSWLHWWEANRDPYLKRLTGQTSAVQHGDESKETARQAALRQAAVEALVRSLQAQDPELRMAAAVALGQMEEESAIDGLGTAANCDGDVRVRLAALMAIGLLDSFEAKEYLLRLDVRDRRQDHDAAMVALGLKRQLGEESLGGLRASILQANVTKKNLTAYTASRRWEVSDRFMPRTRSEEEEEAATGANLAAWALGRHADKDAAAALKNAADKSMQAWLVAEEIRALGGQSPAEAERALIKILLDDPDARNVGAIGYIHARDEQIEKLIKTRDMALRNFQQRCDIWLKEAGNRTAKANLLSKGGDGHEIVFKPVVRNLYHGLEQVNLGNIRVSAALALEQMNSPAAIAALRQVLDEEETPYSQPYQEVAIMALAQMGDRELIPRIFEILQPTVGATQPAMNERRASPRRGLAALALGLFSRPMKNPQLPQSRELVDPPEAEKICVLLGKILTDPGEAEELRAGCALALGLTQRTENLKYLQAAGDSLASGGPVLRGYVLLARGLLADQSILTPAQALLGAARPPGDLPTLTGARAALLGLGLQGSNEALPVLNSAWKRGRLAGLEAARALAVREDPGASAALLDLLKTGAPAEKVFAAQGLGEIFMKVRPSRLAALTNGTNYMMKNFALLPFKTLGNEFLVNALLPGTASWDPQTGAWVNSGEQWNHQDQWERNQAWELLRVIRINHLCGTGVLAWERTWETKYPEYLRLVAEGGEDPLITHIYMWRVAHGNIAGLRAAGGTLLMNTLAATGIEAIELH